MDSAVLASYTTRFSCEEIVMHVTVFIQLSVGSTVSMALVWGPMCAPVILVGREPDVTKVSTEQIVNSMHVHT